VDVMLVAEAPKLAPHRAAMCANIANAIGIAPDRVSVKATTNETLGAIGRREGLAALAVALVER
jgi:2-C-methyl-D-erythritol 2,4-cyclodiphosphate synthase